MTKRLFDVFCASLALTVLFPVMLLICIGIKLADPGPVFYRSRRVGLHGKIFTMYKFRSMYVEQPARPSMITADGDPRVFPFGRFLRKCKLDELPQLYNILIGEMSVVGPRPEDPSIVKQYYAPEHYRSLSVLPGLTSPGSFYYYTQEESSLGLENTEQEYVERLLPVKLALDMIYVRRMSLWYDLRLILRTIAALAQVITGKNRFSAPPEMAEANSIVVPARNEPAENSKRSG
ncbi:MAG: sugar transferase [Candidatus Latescibacterota bacterium]